MQMMQQKKGLCNLWFSQGSAAYGPQAKPGPLLLFVNADWRAATPTHSQTAVTAFSLYQPAGLSPCNREGAQS